MSAVPAYAPIIRRVKDGGIEFDGQRYTHEALERHTGSDVFCDMEVDVDTEKQCFRIYDAWENEICVIELNHVENIGEAANGKG
ncbi:MAG: Mu transposase C-terminal domain-containing protein [Sulfuricurvum sp.]|nr:Mu transposase C-terminal domain-containing protein [Sulfuricurvum sp.]